MATIRDRLRQWLGIEAIENKIPQIVPMINIAKLEQHWSQEASDIRAKINSMETQVSALRLPPNVRLAQLRAGLNILTEFANELQRDLERK